jgi:transposase-like protein
MVHFYRNVFSHVPSTRVREVSHMLKAIHAQESREAADKKGKRCAGITFRKGC